MRHATSGGAAKHFDGNELRKFGGSGRSAGKRAGGSGHRRFGRLVRGGVKRGVLSGDDGAAFDLDDGRFVARAGAGDPLEEEADEDDQPEQDELRGGFGGDTG